MGSSLPLNWFLFNICLERVTAVVVSLKIWWHLPLHFNSFSRDTFKNTSTLRHNLETKALTGVDENVSGSKYPRLPAVRRARPVLIQVVEATEMSRVDGSASLRMTTANLQSESLWCSIRQFLKPAISVELMNLWLLSAMSCWWRLCGQKPV